MVGKGSGYKGRNCKAPMFSCSVPAAYTPLMFHQSQALDTIHMLSDLEDFRKAVHLNNLAHLSSQQKF